MLPVSSDDALVSDLLVPGVLPTDIASLQGLLSAQTLIRTFITLFRGSEDEVFGRLLVLREIGQRADAPRWSPQELRAHFAYIDSVKLETVLKRLRDNDLLVWDGDEAVYWLSSHGRLALAALSSVLDFAGESDAELGYLTAQVAAGQAVGRVSPEALQHLLARLNELQDEFEQAVLSGSEFRIRAAQGRLDAVWRWVEKGTEIIREIAADDELDTHTYRIAQQIGHAQSRMLRMTAVFQRALNGIERQRVHLGASGLNSSDVVHWLRGRTARELSTLVQEAVTPHPEPAFVTAPEMLDMAEYELLERERRQAQQASLPPAQDAPEAARPESERLPMAERLLDDLRILPGPASLVDSILVDDYAVTAYRLSLLSLVGDPESAALSGCVADLARLPLTVRFGGERVAVARGDIAEISEGWLEPRTPAA